MFRLFREQSHPAQCQRPIQVGPTVRHYGTQWSRQELPVERVGRLQVSKAHIQSIIIFIESS